MSAAVRLDDLTLGYDRHPAVHHIDGEIGAGALVAIVGPNGAGKSTLLKGIVGALPPLSGTVELAGIRARDIAYLPQAAELDRSFPIAVDDVVAMGLWRRTGPFGGIGAADRRRIAEAIAAVGLAGFDRRAVGTLSGGQLQRVLFARLLLQDAAVILLDEPFAAIDGRTVEDLLALMLRWHGEGRTVVAVLHDLDLVRRTFPETLLLAREKVAWAPTAEALRPENLLRARAMVEAFDHGAAECRRDAA
jgi:zinc/manganese transport system ATP-binding protein